MAADDEVIEIDEDGNVSKPVKGPIRDSAMTDAERAVRNAHLSCPLVAEYECDREGGDKNICEEHHAQIDRAIEAAKQEGWDRGVGHERTLWQCGKLRAAVHDENEAWQEPMQHAIHRNHDYAPDSCFGCESIRARMEAKDGRVV